MTKFLGLGVAFALLLPTLITVRPALAASCPTPIGTANLSTDPEPTVPIFCVSGLGSPQKTGATDGFGGWIDQFNNTVSGNSPAHLNDGEIGYHTVSIANGGGSAQSQHWEANGYFVGDVSKSTADQGIDLSPMQSATFQNGKLVIEADVSAGQPGFKTSVGGDIFWPEVDWSTSPTPTELNAPETLYGYGYFSSNWSGGCRVQAKHALTCALEDSQTDRPLAGETQDQGPCFPAASNRVMEVSGFEACGTKHFGFSEDFGAPTGAFRSCSDGTVDLCMDRFRFEWSQAGLVVYVNGVKFAEDSGWDVNHQIPASIANGSTPVFAHFFDFGDSADGNVYRVHWARIAVNPHNPDGTPSPPTASCQFLNNCSSPSPTPAPSPTPSAMPTPTPTPTPSPTPSTSPTPSPASFKCIEVDSRNGLVSRTGTCIANSDGSITFRPR